MTNIRPVAAVTAAVCAGTATFLLGRLYQRYTAQNPQAYKLSNSALYAITGFVAGVAGVFFGWRPDLSVKAMPAATLIVPSLEGRLIGIGKQLDAIEANINQPGAPAMLNAAYKNFSEMYNSLSIAERTHYIFRIGNLITRIQNISERLSPVAVLQEMIRSVQA